MERRRSFDKKTRSEWQLNNSHLNTHFRFVTVKETKLRDRSQSTASRTCTMVHRGHCFALLFFFAYMGMLSVVRAVHINKITAPQSFQRGTADNVILDCDFRADTNDNLLVVKWFLNDDRSHIYQWIPSDKRNSSRSYSSIIEPYVDQTFMVNDHATRHRALRLLNPPPTLSGKYTCSVSSLQNADQKSTHLVIYEPASSFTMAAVEVEEEIKGEDSFNITCTATGLYPEPEMKLYRVRSINETLETEEVNSSLTSVLTFQSVTDKLYSITLVSHIDHNQTEESNEIELDDSSEQLPLARARLVSPGGGKTRRNQPNTAQIAEHYECRLTIPNSEYVEVKRLAIQEGWRTKARVNGCHSTSIQQGSMLLRGFLLLVSLFVARHRM